jgi:hypothetical protein
MRTNLHRNFRWTRTTIVTGFICSVAIPVGIYAFCWTEDLKWDITAIRRGQTKEDMKNKALKYIYCIGELNNKKSFISLLNFQLHLFFFYLK